MRGGIGIIVGFILGNETARKACIKALCDASVAIDKEFKKTPLGKIFNKEEQK